MEQLIESARTKYYLGTDTNIAKVLRVDYLQKSRLDYQRALNYAKNSTQIISIYRNLAMAYWREVVCVDKFESKIYLLSEALKYFSYCYNLGIKILQPFEWLADIHQKVAALCLDFSIATSSLPVGKRLGECEKLLSFAQHPYFKAQIYIKAANISHKTSVIALESKKYQECSQFIEETLQYLQRAKPMADELLTDIINDVEGSSMIHKCRCSSIRETAMADQLLRKCLDEENLNFELVWNVVDIYRQAIICTREIDAENEAIAYHRLGKVFRDILKLKDKAHTYYRHAFNLAQSLSPRDFSSALWYRECVDAIQKYQTEKVAEEEKLKNSENEPYLKELEPELKAMKAIHTTESTEIAVLLLKHIYTAHPPKVGTAPIISTITNDNIKDCLKKAFVFYHSDKQSNQPKKWQVLCGEITKHLCSVYTYCKE